MRDDIRHALEQLAFRAGRASADDLAHLISDAIAEQINRRTYEMLTDEERTVIITGYTVAHLLNPIYEVEMPDGMTHLEVAQLVAHEVITSDELVPA